MDRWDLLALGHARYDEWLSDVGPWPDHDEPARCYCCGERPQKPRSVVCDEPDCRAWYEEGLEIHAERKR